MPIVIIALIIALTVLARMGKWSEISLEDRSGGEEINSPNQPANQSRAEARSWREWISRKYTKADEIVQKHREVVVGIILCHALLWYFFREWYMVLFWNPVFWLDHIILLVTYSFLRNSHGKFTRAVWAVLGILIAGNFLAIKDWLSAAPSVPSTFPLAGQRKIERIRHGIHPDLSLLPPDSTIKEKVVHFWHTHLAPKDGGQATAAEEMIAIAERESQFNQFERDGTPYRGRLNPADVGVMQINEEIWAKEIKDLGPRYNIYTLDGNLEFALWLYQNKGGTKPWLTRDKGHPPSTIRTFSVTAPKDAWSKDVQIEGRSYFCYPDGPVIVRVNGKEEIKDEVGNAVLRDVKYLNYKGIQKEVKIECFKEKK